MVARDKPSRALNDDWRAGFEEVRERQLEAGMAASPKQRIEMLEALMEFALKAGTLPKERLEIPAPFPRSKVVSGEKRNGPEGI